MVIERRKTESYFGHEAAFFDRLDSLHFAGCFCRHQCLSRSINLRGPGNRDPHHLRLTRNTHLSSAAGNSVLHRWNFMGPTYFLAVGSRVTAPHSWLEYHDWRRFPLTLGTHRISGKIFGYGDSPEVNFEVVTP